MDYVFRTSMTDVAGDAPDMINSVTSPINNRMFYTTGSTACSANSGVGWFDNPDSSCSYVRLFGSGNGFSWGLQLRKCRMMVRVIN